MDRTGTFYAAEGAIIGYGAQVLVGNGASPEVFEAVAGVKSVTLPETMFNDVIRTHLRSLNRHQEHMAGIRDSSEMSVEGIYIPGEPSLVTAGGGTGPFMTGGLPTLSEDGVDRNFIVRLADIGTSEVEIRGYIKGFSLTNLETENPLGFKFSVQPGQAVVLP